MLTPENTEMPGGSSLPEEVVTGSGVVEPEGHVNLPMAVALPMPVQPPKKDTGLTRRPDAAQELEIFQASFSRLINAGIKVRVGEIYEEGERSLVVVLENCRLISENGKKRIVPL